LGSNDHGITYRCFFCHAGGHLHSRGQDIFIENILWGCNYNPLLWDTSLGGCCNGIVRTDMEKNQRCHSGGQANPIDSREMYTIFGLLLSSIKYHRANRWLLCYLYTSWGRGIFRNDQKWLLDVFFFSFFLFFFRYFFFVFSFIFFFVSAEVYLVSPTKRSTFEQYQILRFTNP